MYTREELDKLTVLDVTDILYERLGTKSSSLPRLEMELLKLKEEYLAEIVEVEKKEEEEEKARIEFLRKQKEAVELKQKQARLGKNKNLSHSIRWSSLVNKREALNSKGHNPSNMEIWFKEFCSKHSHHDIDLYLCELEEFDYDYKFKQEQARIKQEMVDLRRKRDNFLKDTDWTQSVTDSPLNPEKKKDYRLYRKYLRQLPVLIESKQVLDKEVMSFEEWFYNRPVFEGSDVI